MAITYGTITYIENGQAITADVLNSPSVDLEARTDEIKRDSDYTAFKSSYVDNAKVVLVAADGSPASVTAKCQLSEDIRYYSAELDNVYFSVYSDYLPGGRYTVSSSDLSDYFGDGIDGDITVYSRALVAPGDGVYAKIPLRNTGSEEPPSTVYPDQVRGLSEAQLDPQVFLEASTSPELVKLPANTRIDLLSTSSITANSLVEVIREQFSSDIASFTLYSDGSFLIMDANGILLDIFIEGMPNSAECQISRIVDHEDTGRILIDLVPSTMPLFPKLDSRAPTTSLSIKLVRSSGEPVTSSVPMTLFDSGYFIDNPELDIDFAYLPLVRLTESSLLVGNREINLHRYVTPMGTVANSYGAPVEALPEGSGNGVSTNTIPLLQVLQPAADYKGLHRVILNRVTNSNSQLSVSSNLGDPVLNRLIASVTQGDTLIVKRVTINALSDLTFETPEGDLIVTLSADLGASNTSTNLNYTTVSQLPVGAGDSYELEVGTEINVPSGGLVTDSPSVTLAIEDTDASFSSGSVYVVVELFVL